MTNSTKHLLKAALVTGVIGAGFCIAGLCLGFTIGGFSAAIDEGRFQLIGPPDFQKEVGSVVSNTVKGTQESYSHTIPGEVERLDLDLDVIETCRIRLYDGENWQVSGTDLPSGFQCEKEGDTLDIECSRGLNFWGSSEGSFLEILVPMDHMLEKVDIDSGVGEVVIEDGFLVCEKFELDCGVGSTSLRLDVRKKADIDGGVGEVDLVLKGQIGDYNIDVDSGVGEIRIDDIWVKELGGSQTIDYGADRDIQVDSGVGDVKITFEEA